VGPPLRGSPPDHEERLTRETTRVIHAPERSIGRHS
jgi:hypothetical protein